MTTPDLPSSSRLTWFPRWLSSVRVVMILLIALATIFPLGIILYHGLQHRAQAFSDGRTFSGRIADQVVFDQQLLLSSAEQLLSTFHYIPVIRRRDAGAVNALLAELLRKNPQFTNLLMADEKGNAWASGIPLKAPINLADRRYFRNAMATGRFSSGEFNIGRVLDKPALIFGYPLKDESGRITDMAIVSFTLDKYDRYFRSKDLLTEASLALVDHKGTVLFARPSTALTGQQDREDLFRKMTADPDKDSFDAVGLTGVHRVFSYRKLRLPGEPQPYMYVRAGISVSSILERTRKDFLLGLGSIGVAAIIIFLASVLLGKRFVLDKMAALREATERISRGDLSTRVSEIVSGGELGELGDAFDNMARRLQEADAERREAEEEKLNLERQVQRAQKMESLGVLAGGIAHDFNNLLMVVLGHAELALKEISPTSPSRRNLEEISTAAQRAADLSRQMLAYSGKAVFTVVRVGLRELVEEIAHLLKAAISKKATLNLHLEPDLPPIEADPSQIQQIVMNLIINASEAIGDKTGVITVSVGATRCDEEYLRKTELHDGLSPGLYVHLEVTDTGSGMDAETRSRIFEPFFTTKFTGRGLGLAAVLGIVRAHKGALEVSSEPGKGTTFKVLFPALEDAGERERPSSSSALSDWRGKGTLLLVDDEESLTALGRRMLEHLGFTVLTAANGLQAVELYRTRGKEIDLVLMDLTMPHMDGAEALGELRRLNPDVRVVLASGYSREDVAARFAGMGPDGVLQKPYTLAKLREALAGLTPKRMDGKG